jgi:hypothetical protein
MRSSENLGYLTEETLSESFVGGASGVACDLVGDRERQEGLCQASGDVAVEGKLKALHGRHEALVVEMSTRGYRHRSPLAKKEATGSAKQTVYVDRPGAQIVILRKKGCQCDV